MRQIDSPLLQVDGLSVDIHHREQIKRVVRDVGFSVDRGKTLCIVGESGCGKSLTALALLDLLPASARRRVRQLRFAGEDLTRLDETALSRLRGSRISMIFQDPMTSLNPVFTVGDQLTDVLRQHRSVSLIEATERARYLLERVGITNSKVRLRQYPFELSGGLRQRVMIAMALMCEPQLLIADEPTTALDVTIQAELLGLLQGIQQEFGLGIVFITHDLGLVSSIADDLIVMYAGAIVESGPAQALLNAPDHPYTQMLLQCIPRPGLTRAKSALPSIAGVVPSLEEPIRGCAFANRCPIVEARCAETVQAVVVGEKHCLCVKPGALRSAACAKEIA